VVYARELKLTQEARIGALGDTRLGIEGHNWLRQLLFNSRDGDSVASGGVPLALEAEIVKEVRFFRAHGITPVFVFSGLPVVRKEHRAFAKDDHRVAYRHSAWEQYWQGHVEQAQRGWGASPSQAVADLIPFAMQVLQANGAEFMRAPYSAWAQLAYLYRHESQPIHAVYSSLDILMFDVDRVITSISHTRSTFGWVLREHLLSKCGIASEQVLDMCILAGFDWCPTFPALLTDIGFSFKSAVDVTRQYGSGFNAVQMMGDHASVRASNYSDSFLRAYCAVRYHIVLHVDGSVGPLNADSAPNDLHDIIGYRLPATAYHLLARGIVHPPVLSMLASGSWLEFPPPDNGESDEYRRLITQWQAGVFRQQCRVLCGRLGPFFAQRKITLQTWFDPQAEVVLHDSKTTSST
ncbi:PIN domain-like protein, partial [Coemansia reversa NRRL 1564]